MWTPLLSICSTATIDSIITPALESSILRQPEITFQHTFSNILQNLPSESLLSVPACSKLSTNFISTLKSGKSLIRSLALASASTFLQRLDTTALMQFSTTLISLVSPANTGQFEWRQSLLQCAFLIPDEASAYISQKFPNIIEKESNDFCLALAIQVFFHHLERTLGLNDRIPVEVEELIIAGLKSKRGTIVNSWFLGICSILWSKPNMYEQLGPQLKSDVTEIWKDMVSNTNQTVQNGTVPAAVALTAVFLRDKSEDRSFTAMLEQIVEPSNTQSILLNQRFYAKLNSEVEIRWLLRANFSALPLVKMDTSESCRRWSQPLLRFLLAKSQILETRLLAAKFLQDYMALFPGKLRELLCVALQNWADNQQSQVESEILPYAIEAVIKILFPVRIANDENTMSVTVNDVLKYFLLCHHPTIGK